MTQIRALDPSSIYADFESRPPLIREEAQEAYRGKEVDWRLTFANGSAHGEQVHVTFFASSRRARLVAGDVLLSDHPWLKSLRVNEPVRLRGRIREVNAFAIYLDIDELSYERRGTVKANKSVRALSRTVR